MEAKNHVFLMQVHKEPKLLKRILGRLEHPNHYFLINVDRKSRQFSELMRVCNKTKNVLKVTKNNVMHGGFTQIQCTVEQMKAALASPIRADYFHTISGQDYPCCNADAFDAFFQADDKSYMMLDTDQDIDNWLHSKYRERLEHWRFWDVFNGSLSRKLHMAGVFNHLMYGVPRRCDFLEDIWGVELVLFVSRCC